MIRRFQFVSLQEAAAYVATSERPGRAAAPQQSAAAAAAQPSLDWALILESLELTPHQTKARCDLKNSKSETLNACRLAHDLLPGRPAVLCDVRARDGSKQP